MTILLTGLLAIPTGIVLANHFGDVPTSSPFHSDIQAISDAGVTAGCGGGNYCPKANVTREQMAAFMNRLGALGPGKDPVVDADRVDGIDSRAMLIASGFLSAADGLTVGTDNIDSATWDATLDRWIVSISGESYFFSDYVTQVTVADGDGGRATTSSVGGNLLIYTFDETGAPAQRNVSFTVTEP
ncbi:MAG: S-layer homology domain-containing protein [Candidatus Limnocylindria bacterium]